MNSRIRRAGILIGIILVCYLIKMTGDTSVDLVVDMGESYECAPGQLYSGETCVPRNSVNTLAPPCYLGWEERGNTCVWKG